MWKIVVGFGEEVLFNKNDFELWSNGEMQQDHNYPHFI